MSLVKSPEMMDTKIAANQANAQKSSGPVTPEGLERARLGKVKHGLYVADPRVILKLMGKDFKEFDKPPQTAQSVPGASQGGSSRPSETTDAA